METTTGGRITTTTALMALALLAQCGHNERNTPDDWRAAVSAPDSAGVDPHLLETKRAEFTARVRICASQCTASEAMALASVCGDKPLTPEKLSAAAARLSPELRTSVHAIAEILHEYPQLAPEVLTCLHQYLSELPMTDPRKLAGMIIPCHDHSFEDAHNIRTTSEEFLRLEAEAGMYRPPPLETLTADANVRSILTSILESVESAR